MTKRNTRKRSGRKAQSRVEEVIEDPILSSILDDEIEELPSPINGNRVPTDFAFINLLLLICKQTPYLMPHHLAEAPLTSSLDAVFVIQLPSMTRCPSGSEKIR